MEYFGFVFLGVVQIALIILNWLDILQLAWVFAFAPLILSAVCGVMAYALVRVLGF